MRFVVYRLCWLLTLGLAGAASAGCDRGPATTDSREARDASTTEQTNNPASSSRPHRPSDDYFPTVALETSLGMLTIKLDPQTAPRTVHNFLHYVESGFYNQTIFHQVDAGYVVLGGGFTADLTEKPGRYPIPNEAANGRKNLRGTVAMARQPDTIDSSTCQFFVNLSDNPQLDHRGEGPDEYGYCVFGEVIEGLEVLDQIAGVETRTNEHFEKLPVETVLIESAYRLR